MFRGPASKLADLKRMIRLRRRQAACSGATARTPNRSPPKFQTTNLKPQTSNLFSPWCLGGFLSLLSSSPLLNYLHTLGVLVVLFFFSSLLPSSPPLYQHPLQTQADIIGKIYLSGCDVFTYYRGAIRGLRFGVCGLWLNRGEEEKKVYRHAQQGPRKRLFGCDVSWPDLWDRVARVSGRGWPGRWDAGGRRLGQPWSSSGSSRPGSWASKFRPRAANSRISLDPGSKTGENFPGNGLCGLNLTTVVKAQIFFFHLLPRVPRSSFRVPLSPFPARRPSLPAPRSWLPASCPWLLASGFLLLASGFLLLASGFLLLASGFLLLAPGCWLLATGFYRLRGFAQRRPA